MILLDLGTGLNAGDTTLIASHGGPTGAMQTQARMWALRECKAGRIKRRWETPAREGVGWGGRDVLEGKNK